MPEVLDIDALLGDQGDSDVFDVDALLATPPRAPQREPVVIRRATPLGVREVDAAPFLETVGRVASAGAGLAQDLLGLARAPFDWAARTTTRALGIDPSTWTDERGVPANPTSAELGTAALHPERDLGRATSEDFRNAAVEHFQRGELPSALAAAVGAHLGLGLQGDADVELRDSPRALAARNFIEDALRPVENIALAAATDPLTAGGASAAGKALLGAKAGPAAAPVLSGTDQAVAALAATLAGAGAAEKGVEAGTALVEGRPRDAALAGEEALLSGVLAALGARGASEIGARRRANAVDAGPTYQEAVAAREARANAEAANRIAALDRARENVLAQERAPRAAESAPATEAIDLRAETASVPEALGGPRAPREVIDTSFLDKLEPARATELRDVLAGRLEDGTINDAEVQALQHLNRTLGERAALQTENAALTAAEAQAPGRGLPKTPALGEEEVAAIARGLELAPQGAPRLAAPSTAAQRARLVTPEGGGAGRVVYESAPSTVRGSAAARPLLASTENGQAAAAIPESRTPEGYRRIAAERAAARGKAAPRETLWEGGPHVAREVKARLLAEWQKEAVAAKPDPSAPAAREIDPDVAAATVRDRQFLRVFEPAIQAIERLPGVGKELAGRAQEFQGAWEKRLGEWSARTARSLAALGQKPAEVNEALESSGIRKFLDGKAPLEAVPENLRATAQELRAIDVEIGQRAVEAGIIKPEDLIAEGHFPRYATAEHAERFEFRAKAEDLARRRGITVEEASAELSRPGSQLVAGTRAGRVAKSEHVRGAGEHALQEGQYRTDAGVLFEHIREISRRIAEAEHLGADGELVTDLSNKLRAVSPLDQKFAVKFFDRLRDVEPQDTLHRVSSVIRSAQAGGGLVLSPVSQITTLGNTPAEAGGRAFVRGLGSTFLREVKGPDGQPIKWTKPVKRLRASFNDAKLDAEAQGALFASTAERLAEFYTSEVSRQQGASGRFARRVGNLPWVRWTGSVDQLQRVIAANTARHAVPEALARAREGDASAVRQLQRWGIDPQAKSVTPEMIDGAAKIISDRSQFRVGVAELPLWASSPIGKMAFQFQSFLYQHSRMLRWAGQEAAQGNVKPIATLLASGAALGYLSQTLRQALKAKGFDEPSEEGFSTILKDTLPAFTGKKHFAPTSPEGVLLAAIEGQGAAGGLGILQSALERADAGNPLEVLAGAAGTDIAKAVQVLPPTVRQVGAAFERAGARARGDVVGEAAAARHQAEAQEAGGRAVARAGAGVLPQTPVVSPNEVYREFVAERTPVNPGGVGRLRDALSGEPVDREAAQRLERAREEGKAERERREGIKAVKPAEPPKEKADDAEKAALREQAKLEVAEALFGNAGEDEIDALLSKWAQRGVYLGPRRFMVRSNTLQDLREQTLRRK